MKKKNGLTKRKSNLSKVYQNNNSIQPANTFNYKSAKSILDRENGGETMKLGAIDKLLKQIVYCSCNRVVKVDTGCSIIKTSELLCISKEVAK